MHVVGRSCPQCRSIICDVFKVFRYSLSEAIPIFFNRLKVVFSLSDRYKIFTYSNCLWIEICENVVKSILL